MNNCLVFVQSRFLLESFSLEFQYSFSVVHSEITQAVTREGEGACVL